MTNVLSLTDATFDSEVKDSQQPVLIDFWAPWCGPCKKLGPIIEELANEFEGKVKIAKVNVDENQQKASEYGISGIPAVFLFVNGEVKERMVGLQPKSQFEAAIRKYI